MKKFGFVLFLLLVVSLFTSCIRPYDKPTFEEVDTYETAFLIPLLSNGKQDNHEQVNGADYYKSKEVNSKLIKIPHEWIQTGRWRSTGYYRDTIKVVKVSLKPISGTWDLDDKGIIRVETIGSQGIRVPLSFTAKILPEDAALFLSNYPSKALEEVLDNEVNRYVADILGKSFHKVAYEDVAKKRDTILEEAYSDIKQHFAEQGITIVQMGIIDGLVYDDPTLQANIDEQAKIESAKVIAQKRAELLDLEKANKEKEARMDVSVAQIKAATLDIELKRKRGEQEIENQKMIAQAQADAIKQGKYAPVPDTLIVQDLKALGGNYVGDVLQPKN